MSTNKMREALERIADHKNKHFTGDAQVVAREALAADDAARGAVPAAYETVESSIVGRYKVVKRNGGGFWPYCVQAGDGTTELFIGHKTQCEKVAAALQTACLDGAFMASLAATRAAALPCGHPTSLMLHSAETGEPLYCELCDDKSGRADAECMESELLAANESLLGELAAQQAAPTEDDRLDAQRLDWVFSHWPNGIHVECCATGGPTVHGLVPTVTIFYGPQEWKAPSLRAAIDAAMSAQAGGKEKDKCSD